jgi:hypothetical protein
MWRIVLVGKPLTGTSVETEVGPLDLHSRAAFLDDPTLRLGTVAIISKNKC